MTIVKPEKFFFVTRAIVIVIIHPSFVSSNGANHLLNYRLSVFPKGDVKNRGWDNEPCKAIILLLLLLLLLTKQI